MSFFQKTASLLLILSFIFSPLLTVTATGAVNGQNYSETYTYDAIGNITSKNGQTYAYSGTGKANPHAVTSIGSTNYTYDDNGNLLTDENLTNTWNYENRLTQSVVGQTTVEYIYDVSGQRIGYSNGTDVTYYPTKDYNISGAIPTKQIFANDQLVATVKDTGYAAEIYFVHTDHLTGSNIITNGPGTVEEVMDYYPYGDIRLDEKAGTFSEQRKYAGHEYDADTDLSYMNARYYNGKVGRFVSLDPAYLAVGDNSKIKSITNQELQQYLMDPQGFNSYAYARNNPLQYNDPTGEFFGAFGTYVSNSQRSIAQGFYNLAGYINNQGTAGQMLGIRELGMASRVAGDVVSNIANVVDPRQSAGTRLFAVGMVGLDVGSGGKGKTAEKVVSNIIGKEKYISNIADIIPVARQNHILNGDITGGGHKFGAGLGKPEFPSSWTDNQIFHNAADIATDIKSSWTKQRNNNYFVSGIRDGLNMGVVIDKTKSFIVTAFPKTR